MSIDPSEFDYFEDREIAIERAFEEAAAVGEAPDIDVLFDDERTADSIFYDDEGWVR